jgi:mannose/fructose/N-acetylgalactosamine-specific phosphotransferase system component IIB
MTPFRWVRVDDRLLHGQVALGWRSALDPAGYLIVDDEVASDPFSASLFEAALPEGTRLYVLGVDAFLGEGIPPGCVPGSTILLLRGIMQLRRIVEGGVHPTEVNLGGLHHRPGARRYLDYIFLTKEDRDAARWLLDEGVSLVAQDLPSSPRKPLEDLLAHGGEEA